MAIEEIKELDVDGIKVLVTDLSAAQQRFVKVYHDTLQKKADCEDEIIGLNAALRSLSNDLVVSIREDRKKVVEAGGDASAAAAEVDETAGAAPAATDTPAA